MSDQQNYTAQDIETALTRKLTDERVAVASAYWLDASPHEQWVPDGIILARYARQTLPEVQRLRGTTQSAQSLLSLLHHRGYIKYGTYGCPDSNEIMTMIAALSPQKGETHG